MKILTSVCIVLVILSLVVGCGDSKKKEIVGKWGDEFGSVWWEFLDDGTVINYGLITGVGKYKLLDDDRVLIDFGGIFADTYIFEISGDRLILDGEEYVRVK